jgi:transposase
MAIVAHTRPFVIGVDTHARHHAISILACPTGEIVDEAQFPATAAGLSRAVSWAGRPTGGDAGVLWVIEGTGTYGARLARAAADAGYAVVEAPRMNARANRGIGKSDPLDARHPLTATQIVTIAAWRTRDEDLATATARGEATRLAKRVAALDTELKAITKRITDLVRQSPAATLLDQPGIGPVTAAVALTAWSHLGRIRSEAAFASLAGTSPIPASSGNTVRHRINRKGDRRPNRALHMAIVTRMRMDPRTRAYVERRTSEGRTLREIRRCLKRYLAREIYRHLNTAARTQLATT